MEYLIKITEREGKRAVNARDLHLFLESKQQFADWIKSRIEKYDLLEGQDFQVFHNSMNNPNGGRPQVEYALSVDAAKELSMVEGNEKGKQARKYFIECEKIAKGEMALPKTFSEALQLAANQAKEIEEKNALLLEQAPKVDFFDAVADSKDAVPMLEVAKVLNIKGMGRNNLFEFLREQKVLMRNNLPYEKYIDRGYFRVIEQKYTKNFEECINFKTLVYQRGMQFIRNLINNR